jgi:hypothetical protein
MGTPLARYIGVDASAAALQEARRQLVGDEGRTGFENERLANGTSASIGHPRRDMGSRHRLWMSITGSSWSDA